MIIKIYIYLTRIGNFYLKSGLYRLHLLQIWILDDFCKITENCQSGCFYHKQVVQRTLIFNEVTKYIFLCLKLQKKNEKDHSQETNHVLIQKTWSLLIFFAPSQQYQVTLCLLYKWILCQYKVNYSMKCTTFLWKMSLSDL